MSHSLDNILAAAETDPTLAGLYEEVIRRLQAGDPVDLTGLTREHPEYVDPLRRLLPALEALVDLGAPADRPSSRAISKEGISAPAPRALGDYRIVREIGRG